MMALVKTAPTAVELKEVPEPCIQQNNEVKVQIVYSNFCRDDMWPDELSGFGSPGIFGHEAAGIIVEAGKNAQMLGFLPGDRVAINPLSACGHCKKCMAQQEQYCPEASITTGLMAEYVVKNCAQLIKIPDSMTLQQATLIEPIGSVIEAVEKLHIDFFSEVLLIGGGFIGLAFIKLLRLHGVKRISVIEPVEERRRLALEYGADNAFDPDDSELQVKLLNDTDFNGFDVVIDTSAKQHMIEFGLNCLIQGGTIRCFAYQDLQSKLHLPYFNLYARNISIIWSCMSGRKSMAQAAEVIERLDLQKLITKYYPFSQAVAAYENYMGSEEIKIGIRIMS